MWRGGQQAAGMENNSRPVRAVLTKHEEAVLGRRIEAGLVARAARRGEVRCPHDASAAELDRIDAQGRAAFDELVARNLALVGYVVNPIARATGLDRDDLAQEGMIGLLEAVQRFDPHRGSFASCALPRIRMRAWDEAVTAHGTLGLPARRARRWRRAVAVRTELKEHLEREATAEEIAERLGDSGGAVRSLLTFTPTCHLTDDHASVVVSQPPDETVAAEVVALLSVLPEVHRTVLVLRHGLSGEAPMSTRELGQRLRLSASSVRRYEQSALAMLRHGGRDTLAA